jgi:hypothetical protein
MTVHYPQIQVKQQAAAYLQPDRNKNPCNFEAPKSESHSTERVSYYITTSGYSDVRAIVILTTAQLFRHLAAAVEESNWIMGLESRLPPLSFYCTDHFQLSQALSFFR